MRPVAGEMPDAAAGFESLRTLRDRVKDWATCLTK
jgi:hypothetical protein